MRLNVSTVQPGRATIAINMGLTKFVIILDHPVYYSGQTISGKLVVQIDKPMLMRAIYLKYSGKGNVRWTETHRHNNKSHTTTYSSVEHYVGLQQLVFGNDTEDCELDEGEHIFIFNCQLPMNIPSSFEGSYGRIRYSVKATIDRSWKFNHVTRQPITVMSVLDLNQNAFAALPIEDQTSKTFWGHSNQLFMSINLPVRGYVSGQIIPIKVCLNNESGVQVNRIRVSLKQIVTFHATNKSRTGRSNIFRNEFPVPKGLGCEEVPLNLQLPAVPCSYLEFCKIIDLNYELSVTAIANGWYHRNLKIRTELIVGNIPLMGYQRPVPIHQLLDELENPSFSQSQESQPPAYEFNPIPGMMYEDLPPPTYEHCMGLGKSKEKNLGNDPDSDGEVAEFVPLYPVYKFEIT